MCDVFCYLSAEDSDELVLCEADFNVAVTGFVPASLKNITLHKPGDVSWQQIGGLKHVKQTLIETLQWPAKVCDGCIHTHTHTHTIDTCA